MCFAQHFAGAVDGQHGLPCVGVLGRQTRQGNGEVKNVIFILLTKAQLKGAVSSSVIQRRAAV